MGPYLMSKSIEFSICTKLKINRAALYEKWNIQEWSG